jgi:hypothetical protein
VRRAIQESKATAQASAATLANATLSEQTALATAVIDLRITDANIDLLQKTVEAFTESLRVVSNQGAAGTAPPLDVITARTQLENTQASLIALGVARGQNAHAIAVLVGKNPEDLDIPHSTVMPNLPLVPAGVPSALLQRRPDVAIAERQMAAQNAAIGVAVAAYYPNLSLSATGGFLQYHCCRRSSHAVEHGAERAQCKAAALARCGLADRGPGRRLVGERTGRCRQNCGTALKGCRAACECVEMLERSSAHLLSISMLSLRPLLATEIMMPMPISIATPIKVHAVPMRSRMPNFQSAARTPPIRTRNPNRYMPAHFMTNLPIKSGSHTRRMPTYTGAVCMPAY